MKRVVVAVLGCVLLLIGIALLVLPGPGFLLIAAALALLATQFEWAKKPLEYASRMAAAGVEEVARSKFRAFLVVVSAVALGAIGVLDLIGVDIPWVNAVSAVTLIISGLILIGTLVYALRRAQPARAGQQTAAADS